MLARRARSGFWGERGGQELGLVLARLLAQLLVIGQCGGEEALVGRERRPRLTEAVLEARDAVEEPRDRQPLVGLLILVKRRLAAAGLGQLAGALVVDQALAVVQAGVLGRFDGRRLGGGGAGRAVEVALERTGATRIVQLQRRDGSWSRLADELADADLVINATPVGTGSDESPIPAALLRPGLAVYDLVYRPSPTRLVRDARAAGAPARGGAGMLLGQGWRSIELWLSVPAPIEAMRAGLRSALGGEADV